MNTIFCLMGPTASGKTAVALELVRRSPCDIISVDSGMIYRGMDIGTAKPTAVELEQAPHRLINICDPAEKYSAGQFRIDAIHEIEKIFAAKRIPLLVGGTMLYFKVLQQGISALPAADANVRAQIFAQALKIGWEELHKKLVKIDPKMGARISVNDSQRIQRGLEVYQLTGKSLTELQMQNIPQPLPYKTINIALTADREYLHKKIKMRFEEMLSKGFLGEVEQLFTRGDLNADLPSMRTVGYRQMWSYLSGEISFDEMREQVLTATKALAKRQMTWLRPWSQINFFDCRSNELVANINAFVEKELNSGGFCL